MKITLRNLKLIIENFLKEQDEEPSDAEDSEELPFDEEPADEEPVDDEPADDEPVDDEPVDDSKNKEDTDSKEESGETQSEKDQRIKDAAANLSGPEALIAYGGMLNLGGSGKIPAQARRELAKKAGAKKGEVLADDAVYDLETFQSKYEKLFNLAKLG